MWDYISDRTTKPVWLKEALEQGSVILVMDGSYSQTRGPHISGAHWIIACCKSQKILKGSFYKLSTDAGSYTGVLLGLVDFHTLILQLCKYYHILCTNKKIICDSKSTLDG